MEGTSLVECYTTAKSLIAKGIHPIPTVGKKPIVDWRTVTVTPALVDQWQTEKKWSGNIAVICGECSNNLVVIDFDGLDGYEAYKVQFPDLLDTYAVKTGSGKGMHLYYRVDLLPDNANAKDVAALNNNHIEVRAQNLLVTVPPSVHPDTGQSYVVVNEMKAKHVIDLARVVAWVKALNPVAHKEHPSDLRYDDNLNPRVLDALRTHFQNQDKVTKRGDWLDCRCPNPAHEDKEASFGYNIVTGAGNCFYCTNVTFNAKTLCEMVGVDVKALGGLCEAKGVPTNGTGHLSRPAETPPKPEPKAQVELPQSLIYITDRQAQRQLTDVIDGVTIAKHPPLPMPLNFLKRHGIRVLTPGRLCYFATVSGGGKTQMMELIVDRMLERGNDVIIRSDEWISRETYAQDMIARRIQRYGGPTYDQIALHILWEHEEHLHMKWLAKEPGGVNIPRNQREGVQFTPRQYEIYKRIEAKVNALPGQAIFLLEQGVSVEKMIVNIEYAYLEAVHQGRKPMAFFLDYAQLVWMENETNGKIWIEDAMTKIKDMCGKLGLVGFVFSQLNQNATDQVRDGKKFSPTMMNWLSERQCNLLVMWLVERDEQGKYEVEHKSVTNNNTGMTAIVPLRKIYYEVLKSSLSNDEGAKGHLDWNPIWLRIEDAKEEQQCKQGELMGEKNHA
jgi:hypothetical protein